MTEREAKNVLDAVPESFGSPLAFDTSTLLCRYLPDPRRSAVDRVLAGAEYPIVTSMTRTEVTMGLHLAGGQSGSLWSRFAADWAQFWVAPVVPDGPDGVRAAELGARYGLNLANALHLVALDRLPRPASLFTFDDRQIAAAVDLGLGVIDLEPELAGGATAHGLLADP